MSITQTIKDLFAAGSSAGIYWDDCSIGIVQVSGSLRSLEVEHFVSAPLQGGRAPGEAIKEIVSRERLRYERLVSAVPASRAMIRQLPAPFTDLKKLKKTLRYLLEPFTPCNAEAMAADFVKPIHEGRLVTLAVEKKTIAEHLRIFHSAGLSPEVTAVGEIPLYYLYRALNGEGRPGAVCIVNVLPNRMSVQMIRNGRLELLRLIEGPPSKIDPLNQTLRIWKQGNGEQAITEVLVTGPEAGREGVLEKIGQAAQAQTRIWKPFDRLKMKMEGLTDELQLRLSLPLGLAIMGLMSQRHTLNLQRDEFARGNGRGLKIQVLILICSIIAILAISFTNIYRKLYSYEAEYDRLGKSITRIFEEAFPGTMKPLKGRELSQMKQKISEEASQYKWAHEALSGKLSLNVLLSLSSVLSGYPGISVDQIALEDKRITFGGNTTSFNSLDKLKEALSKNTSFSNARLTGTKMDKKDNSISFQFSMETGS